MVSQEAKSINEYMTIVKSEDATLVQDGFKRNDVLYFRGQPDSDYLILPAIGRNRKSPDSYSILNEERNLVETAKFELPELFNDSLTPIELLALLQHHGIPTRLLDITSNPLVALYFACLSNSEDEAKKDGKVIVFKRNELHVANYPAMNAIADSYRFLNGKNEPTYLYAFFEAVTKQPYFTEGKYMVECINYIKMKGEDFLRECCKGTIFVHAANRTRRQYLQQGCYILFYNKIGSLGNDFVFEPYIDPISETEKDSCISGFITIPSEYKKPILEELQLYGITRQKLFADNADIVCEEITKKIGRKGNGSPSQ